MEPPVPIPNTEVKRPSADDTLGGTPWENMPLPGGLTLSKLEREVMIRRWLQSVPLREDSSGLRVLAQYSYILGVEKMATNLIHLADMKDNRLWRYLMSSKKEVLGTFCRGTGHILLERSFSNILQQLFQGGPC